MVLALAIAAFAVAVTLDYRTGLEHDLRNRLISGGLALSRAPASGIKQIDSSLALEGIYVSLPRGSDALPRGSDAGKQGLSGGPGAVKQYGPSRSAPERPLPRSEGNHLVLEMPVLVQRSKGAAGTSPDAVVMATLTATQSSVNTPVHQLIVAEVVAGVGALLVATLLLLWALRTALSPLEHVARVAARIAAGERGRRLQPLHPETELGRMATSFDEMVTALDASVQQAERSEAAMRRFLADASHELRTPIAALHATTETLLRDQPPRPDRDALEAKLARESTRLGALVDDLLSLARLEGSDALARGPVNLMDVAEEVAADIRSRAPGVLIDLTGGQDAIVTGDGDALMRAVRNLVDNAVAATGRSGHIRLEVGSPGTDIVLRVSDNGPGVPAQERERIFDGFVRLGGEGRPGAGLGLAIVRRIAEQHHGHVFCEDTAQGASFVITLPPAGHAAAATSVAAGAETSVP